MDNAVVGKIGYAPDYGHNTMSDLIPTGEAFIRRGATIAKVVDQFGEERTIYRQKGMKDLRIKNTGTTTILAYNRVAAQLIAARIKQLRLAKGMTMLQLSEAMGQKAPSKQRIYEVENCVRKAGFRIGTLYAIAMALNVEIVDLMPTNEATKRFAENPDKLSEDPDGSEAAL